MAGLMALFLFCASVFAESKPWALAVSPFTGGRALREMLEHKVTQSALENLKASEVVSIQVNPGDTVCFEKASNGQLGCLEDFFSFQEFDDLLWVSQRKDKVAVYEIHPKSIKLLMESGIKTLQFFPRIDFGTVTPPAQTLLKLPPSPKEPPWYNKKEFGLIMLCALGVGVVTTAALLNSKPTQYPISFKIE